MPKIGRYEIQGEIGRGAMGIVYLARDPRLQRDVAVKTYSLPDGLPDDLVREFQQRFLREAQAAACLSHPGIVTIYDADEDPRLGLPFIAMEYVPGQSLRQLLEVGDRLQPRWVFRIAGVLADALHRAHEAGIIHRDIKPANILLRAPDGAPKIADFGVARLSTSELTQSGASLGSPAYMSPEQIRGGALDGRSDLFSLAIILYEALCGKRPFTGEDLPSLVYSIAHESPVPITRRVRGLPAGLNRFFEIALAKEPGDRFPDGSNFRQAFEAAGSQKRPIREDGTAAAAESGRAVPSPDPEPTGKTVAGSGSSKPRSAKKKRRGRFLGLKFAAAAVLLLAPVVFWLFWLGRPAHLRLDGKSSLESGRLSLSVDGREVYGRRFSSPNTGKGALNKLLGRDHESFEGWIPIAPGRHEVVAEVFPEDGNPGTRGSVAVDLKAGETRTLRLVAGRSFGAPVSLRVN
ncbi:MAG TPA: serine/threonine-protein kinase [Candidatus Polarisedimenticolia bacterium]|nr:serine/threonine-protein kinase [Candidatus Polarisedimenticolia bacterium]